MTHPHTLVTFLFHSRKSSVTAAGRLALLEPLFAAGIPLVLYMDAWYREWLDPAMVPAHVTIAPLEFEETETWQLVSGRRPRLPEGRNPEKDTTRFLAMMNAKTELVARAVLDGLVTTPHTGFIDAGIAKILADPEASLGRVRDADLDGLDRVLIPGCWEPRERDIEELFDQVDWTFCGGLFLMPSDLALSFAGTCFGALGEFLARGRLAWEVNVWARAATEYPGYFMWFKADHDDRMAMIPWIPRDTLG